MSNKEERKAPVLRFKGFTDDWEQRKLGTAIKIIKDKNKNQHSYRAFSISNIKGFIAQDEQFGKDNTYSKTDKSTNYIVKPGMFAYNPARINVGSIAYQNQTEPVLVSSLYEIFQTNSKIDDSFLMNWFKTSLFNRQIKRLEEGGVRQYFFIDKMKETEIKLPSISEQNQISKLLQLVNKNLDLQQQKNADIINLKKAILDKIFSNSNIQKWRDIRLNKVLSIPVDEPKEVTNIDDIISVKLNTQGISKIPNRSTLKLGSTKYYVRHGGQFIFGKQNFFNGSMAIIPSEYDGKVSSKDVPSLNINKDIVMPYFLWLYLSRPSFYKKTERWATGTGSKRLHIKDLLSLKIYIPNKNEQLRICKLMRSLDTQILKSQKHLKELQSIKKFLLQNMFI